MNREILFKAKRIDNGEWVTGTPVFVEEYTDMYWWDSEEQLLRYTSVGRTTLCQFTGLTDKNGVKIWENSILCYKGYKTPLYGVVKFEEFITDDSEQYIGFFVEWAPNGDGVKWADLRCDIGYWAVDNYTEVIGNRFDNPELLTT